MTRIKGLGVEIKQRSTDIFQNKHEGLECDTDREGKRGGEEIRVMIKLIATCRMCQRGTGGMKRHGEEAVAHRAATEVRAGCSATSHVNIKKMQCGRQWREGGGEKRALLFPITYR